MLDYSEVTPATIAAAKAQANLERRAVEHLSGCTILPNGRVILPTDDELIGLRIANAIYAAVWGRTNQWRS